MLKEIEEYNRYDCRSTRKLRDWLICRAIESRCRPVGAQPVHGRRPRSRSTTSWRASWLQFVGDDPTARNPEQTAVAMIAGGPRVPPARGQAVLVGATSTG